MPIPAWPYGFAIQVRKNRPAWAGSAFCFIFCFMKAEYPTVGHALRQPRKKAVKQTPQK